MELSSENNLFENALTAFITDAAAATRKAQKIKQNLECRRKLELLKEELRLKRETCEFEFEIV